MNEKDKPDESLADNPLKQMDERLIASLRAQGIIVTEAKSASSHGRITTTFVPRRQNLKEDKNEK